MSSRPLAVAGKDLKTSLHDTQMLFFSLALPLVLVLLMVAAFGGQTQFNAKAYLVNLDQGSSGAELVRRLEAEPGITVETLDQAAAERRLADSDITNVVVIERDFSAKLVAGETPTVILRQRGTGGTEGQIVDSYVAGLARQMAREQQVARQVGQVLTASGRPVAEAVIEAKVTALSQEARLDPPLEVREETVGARSEPVAVYLPGLTTMFTLFAVSLTSVALVEERRKGTFERLMTTRLTRGELLAGTWLGSLGRGLVQVIVLFGLAWLIFRIFTPASFANLLAFGAIAVASIAGVGLVIASVARTPDQANWIGVFFTMIMTTLGGSFFDTAGAKGVLGVLTRATYNFWANDGFRRIILRGESLASPAIVRDVAVLVGIGLACWVIALAFFRQRGDDK